MTVVHQMSGRRLLHPLLPYQDTGLDGQPNECNVNDNVQWLLEVNFSMSQGKLEIEL